MLFHRPEKLEQLKGISSFPLIARGNGTKPTDAAKNEGASVILMHRLNRFLAFDSEKGIVKAEAGVTIEEILQVFSPRGWFLPVIPSDPKATLGGCVATDIYSYNHLHAGSFGKYVLEIELYLANGSTQKCSRKMEPELFWATIGGFGLTGIIVEITIQLVPIETAYFIGKRQFGQDFDQVLDLLLETMPIDKHSYAWIHCGESRKKLGRGGVLQAHQASLHELPSEIREPLKGKNRERGGLFNSLPSWLLYPRTLRTFQKICEQMKKRAKNPFLLSYSDFFFSSKHQALYKKGFSPYECVLPVQTAREALHQIISLMAKKGYSSSLGYLHICGKEGESALSYPREGVSFSIALRGPREELFAFLKTVDEIVLRHEGRVSLVKDVRLDARHFRSMYPRLRKWQRIKATFDPSNLFQSNLSKRLELEKIV